MAGNQRRQGLGQPDGGNLSAIDRALRDIVRNTQVQPDEFTINMLVERQSAVKRETIKKKLAAMVRDGELSARSVIVDGLRMNVYKYID